MSSYFARTLHCSFDDAVQRVTHALKIAGLSILTEIDLKETFKKKLGIDFRDYYILGVCNPAAAREALVIEDRIGTTLICNIIVQDVGAGNVEVAVADPVTLTAAVDNNSLHQVLKSMRETLKSTIETL